MKAARKDEEKWVPIVITLESKEEAQYLWHCLSRPEDVIRVGCSKSIPFPKFAPDSDMFEKINEYAIFFNKE